MLRRSRLALLLALALLLGACSSLSYRFADWWARWTIDDLVTLDSAQERALDQRLSELLGWHRQAELPRYRAWLQEVRGELAQPALALPRWRQRSQQLGQFWTAAMQRLQPDAAALLRELSDEQVAELTGNLREQGEERAEEWAELSTEKLVQRREKNMVKQLQRWSGRLDGAQRERVRTWSRQLLDNREQRLRQRRQWIDDFERALRRRGESDWFAAELEELMLRPEQRWREDYRLSLEQNTELTLALLSDIHASLSRRQRDTLDRHVEAWIGRFERLAAG